MLRNYVKRWSVLLFIVFCLFNQFSIVFADNPGGQCYNNPTKAATDPECVRSFACESIFADHTSATKCNYTRCLAERSEGYCSCKYGDKWSGIGVGIPLNTSIPFIGNCLAKSDWSTNDTAALNAFPSIISAISRMLVTVILLVGFIMIVVGGVQWASGDAKSGKDKITKVAIGFAILGMMGAILRFINPNFFKQPDIR